VCTQHQMSQTLTISAMIIASIFISLVVGQTCPAGTNIVNNPSFENPQIAPGGFVSLPLNGLPGWTGLLVQPDTCNIEGLDLLNNFDGLLASAGNQFVELDAECNTVVIQDLVTVPGLYVLSYDYSPRPGVDAASNLMNVYYDGVQINSVSTSGVGLTNTAWTTYSQLVTATGADQIAFESLGTSDAQGALLDNVMFCPLVCAPPPPCRSLVIDPIQGCLYPPAADGMPCSSTCTGYVCRAGICVPPAVPCDQPEDHKYYPGYHYEPKAYNYKTNVHTGYGYQYKSTGYGDHDDYHHKHEHKPKHHGNEYKPPAYGDDDDYKYKNEPPAYGDDDDYSYKPKDHGYKSERSSGYGGRRSHH